MALASAARLQVRYIKEVTYGVTPATNPSNLRVTGEGLDYSIQFETSKEIRSDRMTSDVVQTGASADGGLPFELSYGEFDPLLEGVLQSTFLGIGTAGAQVTPVVPTSATFTANTLTAGATMATLPNVQKGQWVRVAGSSIPGQNILAQASKTIAATTTLLTFEGTPFAGATGNGGAAVTLSSARLSNGVVQSSYTIEEEFSDISQWFAYRGMTPSKLSLSFQSGSIVTGNIDFLGKDAIRSATRITGGSPVASKTYDVMNAVSGVGNVFENGVALAGTFVKSLTLNVDNALRGQTAISVLGNAGIASGTLGVTAAITIYLADGTLYDKFIATTVTSFSFSCVDNLGNGYVFTLPKVKFKDMKIEAGNKDSDVMLSGSLEALYEPTITQKMIVIDRVGSIP